MTASLYQSGSLLSACAIVLTFAAPAVPRNYRFKTARRSTSAKKGGHASVAAHKSSWNRGYPLIFEICEATHCHFPPRIIQVSVKRNVRSNALPSLPLPTSRARPVTTAMSLPYILTLSLSFLADL